MSGSHDNDDDDDGEDDDTSIPNNQQTNAQHNEFNPILQIFNVVSNILLKSAASAAQKSGTQLIGFDRNEELKGDNGSIDDNDDGWESAYAQTNATTERALEEGRQSYIKGDPLNGYYDFVITEGSYKFWVIFQLGTAALLIYSCLAAIYYSKVNPLTSDYDYVEYLSRSFNGRSMSDDTADVEDDVETSIEPGRTYLSSLANNKWFQAASYGFQFAMDAIDKIPQ
ncbi:CLUMA_CG015894, isoform A [Clunio marinus]|uniref:CLUMA_CG015894, isoform A n=1 Tax=Clunio marinus TaxID=568069 RepID=A0A1J1IQZ2_9DIPT|nr:CLUMA_CG015894, isoform A [Clunio marinus]